MRDNNLLAIIPSWGPIFKISFELKVFSFSTCSPTGMANYLTFTATDNNCCDIGDRIPAFFTNSGGFLQLATQIDETGNLMERSPQLEENKWYKVEVEQWFEDEKVRFLFNVAQIKCDVSVLFCAQSRGKRSLQKKSDKSKKLQKCQNLCSQVFTCKCHDKKPFLSKLNNKNPCGRGRYLIQIYKYNI